MSTRRRWNFYPPDHDDYYPPPYPQHHGLSVEDAVNAREWWEKIEKTLKKDDKKEEHKKSLMHQTLNYAQVLLLLVGTSPVVALIYKFMIIPALVK